MSYCINPTCSERQNLETKDVCQNCGTKLLICDRYQLIKPLRRLDPIFPTEIFEVEDTREGGVKVIKILKPDEQSLQLLKWFEQEKDILTNLEHPGIPKADKDAYFKVYLSEIQKLHCLVMEKIEGQNLEYYIQYSGVISQEQAINWLKQIIKILDKVHKQGFFHRDIKPSNIMIKLTPQLDDRTEKFNTEITHISDNNLVLIDFGTARKLTQTVIEGKTLTTIFSSGYTAPEQMNGRVVPQSDFYALGRTLVHVLTGLHPNKLSIDSKTGKLIWREKATQISTPLASLIDKLMADSAQDRPQDTTEILRTLENMEILQPDFRQKWFVKVGLVTFGAIIGSLFGVTIGINLHRLSSDANEQNHLVQKLEEQRQAIQKLEARVNQIDYITVNANVGFQKRFQVKKGQTVILEPEGYIHIASEQLKNFGDAIRPLIVRGLPEERWSSEIIEQYQTQYKFKDKNKEFIRTWRDARGEDFQSPMLEDCKLKKDRPWGNLMVIFIPESKSSYVSELADPFEVLEKSGLITDNLIPVTEKPIFIKEDGWLAFIVNEAVISGNTLASNTSKKYYNAIQRSVQELGMSGNGRHIVDLKTVPLTFFYDNVGSFRVRTTIK